MLKKIKCLLDILSIGLIIFVITTNLVFAEQSKDGLNISQNSSSQILLMVVLFACMYFLLLRPQSKKAKEHRDLVARLTTGDEIITIGGLLGKIQKVLDNFIIVSIANNVEVTIQKQAIVQILPKDTIKSL